MVNVNEHCSSIDSSLKENIILLHTCMPVNKIIIHVNRATCIYIYIYKYISTNVYINVYKYVHAAVCDKRC